MIHGENTITDTEALIKNAAKKVFMKKGLAGARLQEIADEAGIGRTALHYYFRSKEKLFAVVWHEFFSEAGKRMEPASDIDMPIIERMQFFVGNYIDHALQDPQMDIFMLNEFNNNGEVLRKIIESASETNPVTLMVTAIEKAVAQGEIKGDPKQIFITLLSICMFPFAAMSMLKSMMHLSQEAYMNTMQERKKHVLHFLKTAFQS